MRAAMRSLRLAELVPGVATNGIIKKVDPSKAPVIAAEQQPGVAAKLDDPRQEFDVSKLIAQIEQECVFTQTDLERLVAPRTQPNGAVIPAKFHTVCRSCPDQCGSDFPVVCLCLQFP